ncbi:hypothetical protein HF072_00875 [Bacillus sp. RO3]|nr:hypothetical protein [Bacillus sp. RO3]
MDRELQRQVRKMTDEGLEGFDFTSRMKDHVWKRVTGEKPKKTYRRRWYAPLISFGLILLFVFIYAVVKGEQWGYLGSEQLSGFFTNKSNFDVEIRYDEGTTISTFTETIKNGEGNEKPLTFTRAEMSEIYNRVESLDLKGIEKLSKREDCSIHSLWNYEMIIRMNDEVYQYYYSDCGTTADRRALDDLQHLILTMIERKPRYEEMLKSKRTM